MRRTTVAMIGLLMAGVLTLAAQTEPEPLSADELLHRINVSWQGRSFHGVVSLEVTLGGQTKSHRLEVWTLGKELALIRVLEPPSDVNSGYLQMGDDLWYYAPGIGTIKLPAMAVGDALFGAGPSLKDLSRGTLSDDYEVTAEVTETGYFLSMIPYPDSPVVFGRLDLWATADYVMEKMVTYDQRGDVLQTATFSDVIDVRGQKLPSTVVIEDSFGDRTVQRIELAQFDIALDALFFSLDTFRTWGEDE